MVYYTGVEAGRQQGSLLVATGQDLDSLTKRAVMLKAPEGQGNIKEATVAQAGDGSWRMFYEYAATALRGSAWLRRPSSAGRGLRSNAR